MKKEFTDRFEWDLVKFSEGNPYIVQDFVEGRNRERERQQTRER